MGKLLFIQCKSGTIGSQELNECEELMGIAERFGGAAYLAWRPSKYSYSLAKITPTWLSTKRRGIEKWTKRQTVT